MKLNDKAIYDSGNRAGTELFERTEYSLVDVSHEENRTGRFFAEYRPPAIVPVSMAVLGGRRHKAYKVTPIHRQQAELGANMQLTGVWQRAQFFGSDPKARDEIRNVRTNVGFIDVSTLGKFKVFWT